MDPITYGNFVGPMSAASIAGMATDPTQAGPPPDGIQTFNDVSSGLRNIGENIAAGFAKDPRVRQQYQQQLAYEQQQRQQQIQQLRAQQLDYMDKMFQVAANGGYTDGVKKMVQAAAPSMTKLFGKEQADQYLALIEAAGSQVPKTELEQKVASLKAQGITPTPDQIMELAGIKAGGPESDVGKIEADLKAGRITQPEADAAIAKAQHIAAPIQINLGDKPITQQQAVTLGYADRMAAADQLISGSGYRPSTISEGLGNLPIIGNALQSSDQQQYNQAKLDFMTADLRKESGAVISPDEFATEDKKFFPQPNDDQKTIDLKAAARKRAIDNARREGRNVTGAEAAGNPPAATAGSSVPQEQPQGGVSAASISKMSLQELEKLDVKKLDAQELLAAKQRYDELQTKK